VADELAVWLYGDHVASIEHDRRGPRLTYTDTTLARYPLGTPLLTLPLPVAARTYPQGVVRSFLDGLLLHMHPPPDGCRRPVAPAYSLARRGRGARHRGARHTVRKDREIRWRKSSL